MMVMAHSQVFYGRMQDGRPIMYDPETFQRAKDALNGKEIEVRICKRRVDRSSQANRYYWGVVLNVFSDFTGHTPDELHEACKQRFLIDRTDERLPRVRSTSSLNSAEFSQYVDNCIQLAAEFGCVIPDAQ